MIMKELTETQLQELARDFSLIDFSQPKAQAMFEMLEKTLKAYIFDLKLTTVREYRYFKLGVQAAFAKQKADAVLYEKYVEWKKSRKFTVVDGESKQ